jgi:hypothetical protein
MLSPTLRRMASHGEHGGIDMRLADRFGAGARVELGALARPARECPSLGTPE